MTQLRSTYGWRGTTIKAHISNKLVRHRLTQKNKIYFQTLYIEKRKSKKNSKNNSWILSLWPLSLIIVHIFIPSPSIFGHLFIRFIDFVIFYVCMFLMEVTGQKRRCFFFPSLLFIYFKGKFSILSILKFKWMNLL